MKNMKIQDMTKMALFAALLSVSAFISIPIGTVPVTLQTLFVNLAALLLTPFQAFVTILVYVLLGAAGLPVFAGASGGFDKLFGPTGGFIMAFLLAAPLMSKINILLQNMNNKRKKKKQTMAMILSFLVCVFVGMTLIYGIGLVYLKFNLSMTFAQAFLVAILPFLPLDIIKCALAAFLAQILKKSLRNV